MNAPCGILLAAGMGRRFGGNKLLQPLDDGTPLLLQAVRNMQAALAQTLVVVDSEMSEVQNLLEGEGVEIVLNPDAARGMGSSLACGVQASASADGWIIALADMPWIQPQTIQTVVASIDDDQAICAPSYEGQRGHPVGFGRGYAEALMGLDGDVGARGVVAANRQHLRLIDTSDPGILADIDYPHDLPVPSAMKP